MMTLCIVAALMSITAGPENYFWYDLIPITQFMITLLSDVIHDLNYQRNTKFFLTVIKRKVVGRCKVFLRNKYFYFAKVTVQLFAVSQNICVLKKCW